MDKSASEINQPVQEQPLQPAQNKNAVPPKLVLLSTITIVLLITVLGAVYFLSTKKSQQSLQVSQQEVSKPASTPTSSPPSSGSSTFTVKGNKISSSNGAQFVVKGMTPMYGPFVAGDPTGDWSTYSLKNAASIFHDLKTNWPGVNIVRIFTAGQVANDPNFPLANYKTKLWDVVQKARAEGFVVLLVNSYSNIADTRSWIKELALRYKDDPYIWITPSNEPFCTSPDTAEKSHCLEWQYWQNNMNTFISDIRSQGFHNPLLVNGINYSWDLSQIGTYPLSDPDNNIIYGAHRYAYNGDTLNTSFTDSEKNDVNSKWANLSTTYPIVADELGNFNEGQTNFTWLQGMVDFITDWVNTRQGDGMIAFNHYWSDANSQTNDGKLPNTWGNYYINNYLRKVK